MKNFVIISVYFQSPKAKNPLDFKFNFISLMGNAIL
jgi:hypothetical protein